VSTERWTARARRAKLAKRMVGPTSARGQRSAGSSAAPSPVRVLIADYQPLYREALAQAIGKDRGLQLVAQARDGLDVLDYTTELRPDVVVLEVSLPELDGSEVLHELTRRRLDTRILFLSADVDPGLIYAAMVAGAGGYLSKTADRLTVCRAIHDVARGETVLSSEMREAVFREARSREDSRVTPTLTTREHAVLELLAEGRSVVAVGRELNIAPATVKTHIRRIYEKLGVSTRAAAVTEAMREGLLN
jgi:two-component system, NarL family, nitrate/nitrite response regulator NarL